uniref:Uncharacterized protein n=1 Tax=Knipowitschia caucasica TaxID=637954 RepID=A0AAV2J4I6_KNICA
MARAGSGPPRRDALGLLSRDVSHGSGSQRHEPATLNQRLAVVPSPAPVHLKLMMETDCSVKEVSALLLCSVLITVTMHQVVLGDHGQRASNGK